MLLILGRKPSWWHDRHQVPFPSNPQRVILSQLKAKKATKHCQWCPRRLRGYALHGERSWSHGHGGLDVSPGAGSPGLATGLRRATGSSQAAGAEAGQSRSSWPDPCACIPPAEGGGKAVVPKEEAAELLAKPDNLPVLMRQHHQWGLAWQLMGRKTHQRVIISPSHFPCLPLLGGPGVDF